MTKLFFNADLIRLRLSQIPAEFALVFGVWELERMIPNFVQFSIESGAKGAWSLKCVVTHAWRAIESEDASPRSDLNSGFCERYAPDTEGSKFSYVSSALDTVTAAEELIRYMKYGDVDAIVNMAILAHDSADIFIQLNCSEIDEAENADDVIRRHPLMQLELQRQESDLSFLESLSPRNDKWLSAVMARSLAEAYGERWL